MGIASAKSRPLNTNTLPVALTNNAGFFQIIGQ
jgi:hypothetical protein